MSPSPPSSPLQKMKTPFIRRSRISIRPRTTTRASIAVLSVVCLIFSLNELRCMKYGCVSRVGFYGDKDSSFVGGGSVIPNTNNEAMGDTGWDPLAIVPGYGAKDGKEEMVKLAKQLPWGSDSDGTFTEDKEAVREMENGKGVLVGVEDAEYAEGKIKVDDGRWIDEGKDSGSKEKQNTLNLETATTIMDVLSQAAVITSIQSPTSSVVTAVTSPKPKPTKPPAQGLSKETLLRPGHQLDDSTKDMVMFDAPENTETTALPNKGDLKDDSFALTSSANNESGDLEWPGREDDPPTYTSSHNNAFKGSATVSQDNWRQNEGQDDPVRLSNPRNSTKINLGEMKVAMSELLSDFRAT